MAVETYSDKEVAVGNVEMDHEMFHEAITATKEGMLLPTDAECAKHVKEHFDTKYGGNWMVIVGEGYGLFIAHKTDKFCHFFFKKKSIVIFKVE